jgi:hypothetical protein
LIRLSNLDDVGCVTVTVCLAVVTIAIAATIAVAAVAYVTTKRFEPLEPVTFVPVPVTVTIM